MPPSTHDGSHGPDCFGCKIKSIQFGPSATPTRRTPAGKAPAAPAESNNSWEKGIIRDERGLPIRRGGKVIGVKEYERDRRSIDAGIRALKQGHDPTAAMAAG